MNFGGIFSKMLNLSLGLVSFDTIHLFIDKSPHGPALLNLMYGINRHFIVPSKIGFF